MNVKFSAHKSLSTSDEIGFQWNTNQTHFSFLHLHRFICEKYKIVQYPFSFVVKFLFDEKKNSYEYFGCFKTVQTQVKTIQFANFQKKSQQSSLLTNSLQMISKQSCGRSKRLNSCQSSMGELVNNLMKRKGTKKS